MNRPKFKGPLLFAEAEMIRLTRRGAAMLAKPVTAYLVVSYWFVSPGHEGWSVRPKGTGYFATVGEAEQYISELDGRHILSVVVRIRLDPLAMTEAVNGEQP